MVGLKGVRWVALSVIRLELMKGNSMEDLKAEQMEYSMVAKLVLRRVEQLGHC